MPIKATKVRIVCELRGWAIRGALCALPSLAWALMWYSEPLLVAAMLVGIATYVSVFSVIFATAFVDPTTMWGRFGARIKKAVVIKLGIVLPVAIVALLMSSLLRVHSLFPLAFILSDGLTGSFSCSIVNGQVPGKSAGSVLLTTLSQGGFITAQLVLLSFIPLLQKRRP
jgi:hypothetical protein